MRSRLSSSCQEFKSHPSSQAKKAHQFIEEHATFDDGLRVLPYSSPRAADDLAERIERAMLWARDGTSAND